MMRIPQSAIVMSLVAAVPFSLAIRDTIMHRDRVQQHERTVETEARRRARRVRSPWERRIAAEHGNT